MESSINGRFLLIEMRRIIPSLNPKEQLIAKAIVSDPLQISNKTITDMAGDIGVSQGLIVRFCQKLGLLGFSELKKRLKEVEKYYLEKELYLHDSPQDILEKVFLNSIQAMKDSLAVMDRESFAKACELIINGQKVEIYGINRSRTIAQDAYHKFLRIGLNCRVEIDPKMQLMSASLLGPGSVAIGISHSGRAPSVVDSLKKAKEVGASTIAITNYKGGPIDSYADVSLYSVIYGGQGTSPVTEENGTSRLVQLAIIDSLFSYVTLNKADAMINLTKTLEAIAHKRY